MNYIEFSNVKNTEDKLYLGSAHLYLMSNERSVDKIKNSHIGFEGVFNVRCMFLSNELKNNKINNFSKYVF